MKLRKLKLESGVWRYRVDKGVTVWTPSGKRHFVPHNDVFTICMCSCPPEYQCFGKGFSPGSLRKYCETHLLS